MPWRSSVDSSVLQWSTSQASTLCGAGQRNERFIVSQYDEWTTAKLEMSSEQGGNGHQLMVIEVPSEGFWRKSSVCTCYAAQISALVQCGDTNLFRPVKLLWPPKLQETDLSEGGEKGQ